MEMVMPRAFSSGALSIWSKAVKETLGFFSARTLVMAAVRVVLPWSIWPIVPTLTWGLVRSNFFFAIGFLFVYFTLLQHGTQFCVPDVLLQRTPDTLHYVSVGLFPDLALLFASNS